MPSPIEEMRIVARRLQPLNVEFVFVGGGVMRLLVDNPDVTQFRRTKDVDVVVAITTYPELEKLEGRLRQNGFANDTSEGAPICRWVVDGCRVDIMPVEPASLGMNTRWFPEALRLAVVKDLGESFCANVISKPLFIATKLEAFKDRGKGDFYKSHDLEDIITLVDGCASIVEETAASELAVKAFVSQGIAKIIAHADFSDALVGHLSERPRFPLVMQRLNALASLAAIP